MGSVDQLEECANCGRAIGKLETPNVFKDQIVCTECYGRLSPTVNYATPVRATAVPAPQPTAPTDVNRATDAVVGRVIVIVLLLIFIFICISVIIAKMSTW